MSLHVYELIGEGAYGKVYRCIYEKKEVAVKIVEIDYIDALAREIILLQYLQEKTEHVPIVYAVCLLENNLIAIVMERCSKIGIVHNKYLRETLKVFTKAVRDLHRHQIVHRDLTPNNLMIRPNNVVCIIDYGLACFAGSFSQRTNFTTKVTTLTSRPPELLTDNEFLNYDPFKVDIYATAINALFFSGYKTYIKYPKSKDYVEHIIQPLQNAKELANCEEINDMTEYEPDLRPTADQIYKALESVPFCNLPRKTGKQPEESPVPTVYTILENQQTTWTRCKHHVTHKILLYDTFRPYTSGNLVFTQAEHLSTEVCDGHCLQFAAASLAICMNIESKQSLELYDMLRYWCKCEKNDFKLYIGKALVRSSTLSWLLFSTNVLDDESN